MITGPCFQDALQETETISLEQAESHLDENSYSWYNKQLRLCRKSSNRVAGVFPTDVTLETRSASYPTAGTGDSSAVDIRVDTGDEQLEAHLQVNGEHIEGYPWWKYPGRGYETGKTSDIFLEWIQTDTFCRLESEKLAVSSRI